MNVVLAIEIDESGAPQRISKTPAEMTPAQRETYDSLYNAYAAEKRAWWTWAELRQRWQAISPFAKEAQRREQHWQQAAEKTERMLEVHG